MYGAKDIIDLQFARKSQNLFRLDFHKANWKQTEKKIPKEKLAKYRSLPDMVFNANHML